MITKIIIYLFKNMLCTLDILIQIYCNYFNIFYIVHRYFLNRRTYYFYSNLFKNCNILQFYKNILLKEI